MLIVPYYLSKILGTKVNRGFISYNMESWRRLQTNIYNKPIHRKYLKYVPMNNTSLQYDNGQSLL